MNYSADILGMKGEQKLLGGIGNDWRETKRPEAYLIYLVFGTLLGK